MTNNNLVKMALGVALATVTNFSVNANEVMPVEKAVAAEESTSFLQKDTFAQLLSKFDADKNGSLSENELSTSTNDALKVAFKNLDVNEDANISSDEFSAYASKKLN